MSLCACSHLDRRKESTNVADFLISVSVNPYALTAIIWGIIFVASTLMMREGLLAGCFATVLAALVSAVVVSALFWLFFQFSFGILVTIDFWLLAGSLVLGIPIVLLAVASLMEGDLGLGSAAGGCGGLMITVIGLIASVLGIITFIVEYVLTD